jgi:predicted Rossmann fold flavoprotein
MKNKYDRIIIGAGAAGMMCAYIAGLRGRKVLLIDHSHKLAEKIRISGGGRCNFTNLYTKPSSYISANPHFSISALSRYTPNHFCELLDNFNISYHEKTLGQLFCNTSSQDIINLLDFLCNSQGVVRKMSVSVDNIQKSPTGFILNTNIGILNSETLVIATGGLAMPQVGSTGFGYNIAKQFGLNVIKPEPALVPLAIDPNDLLNFNDLSGVSFNSCVSSDKISFLESTLLTHRGLSGPAILQISSYHQAGNAIKINMLPQVDIVESIANNKTSNKLLSTFLQQFLSQRLSDSICKIIGINKQICQLSNKEIASISNVIHHLSLKPTGTLGYKKAEVTKGGVDTTMLSSKTMEATKVSGLYFIGEVVDVTGWLGGYNFQWAWASAFACGNSL